MEILAQVIAGGLGAGAMYALIAIGISLTYRTTRVINVAQGDFATLGAYLGYTIYVSLELPLAVALILVPVSTGLILMALERVVLRPLYDRGIFYPIISTVGLSFAIQGAILFSWGAVGKVFPPVFGTAPLNWFGVAVPRYDLLMLVVGLTLATAIGLALTRTRMGGALRSTAQDPYAASLMGVRTGRMYSSTYFVAGALGGFAGMLIAPATYMLPAMGLELTLLAFVAAIIGGLGNIPGAVVGGLVVGVVGSLSGYVISASYQSVAAYVVLALLLLVRPAGLFGEEGYQVREV